MLTQGLWCSSVRPNHNPQTMRN